MIVDIHVGEDTHRINFDDWTLAEWADFEASTGASWITWNPIAHAADAQRLVKYASSRFGFDPALIDSRDKLWESVKYAAPDLPEEHENGIPPVADDPLTDLSSGSSADSDGLPTSSDDNQSETSDCS